MRTRLLAGLVGTFCSFSSLLALGAPTPDGPPDPSPSAALRPCMPAGYRSGPYEGVDPRSRIAGVLQRLYRRWHGAAGKQPTAAQVRAAGSPVTRRVVVE